MTMIKHVNSTLKMFRDDILDIARNGFSVSTEFPEEPSSMPELITGHIVDTISGAREYDIELDNGMRATMPAISSTGFHPLAPRNIGILTTHTEVLCMWWPDQMKGYVVGAVPTIQRDPKAVMPGYIVPFSCADYHNDVVHNYRLTQEAAGNIPSFNCNEPLDAIPGSDTGTINELGGGHGVSRWFTWMRGTELSAMYMFYMDHLVRLVAYNYERWTAAGEYWLKNDQYEVNEVETFTPYPWESLGLMDQGDEAFEYDGDGGKYQKAQFNCLYMPKEPGQTNIFRHLKLRGYIGDIERDMVVAPEEGKVPAIETIRSESNYTGLLDIQKHIDGHYHLRSARAISLHKYILLPVPKQIARPEGETLSEGDNDENYKFSSAKGGGPEHPKDKYIWEDEEEYALGWFNEVFDFHAYMFNWYGLVPVAHHEKDWFLPQETESGPASGSKASYVPDGDLSSDFLFKLPQVAEIKIDHRAEAKYYFSRAGIDILPDGSVLIEDGYGSSIFMSGGSIFRTCAGDDWCLTGRSQITWAGDDISHRAGSSVDVSAAKGDVRLKAEANLHAIAGNKESNGGILLEARSTSGTFNFTGVQGEDVIHNGITLKTENAPLLMYSSEMYARTLQAGTITLDADKGSGGIIQIADNHARWATEYFADIAGGNPYDNPVLRKPQASLSLFNRNIHTVGGNDTLHCDSSAVTFASTRGDVGMVVAGPVGCKSLIAEEGAMIGVYAIVTGAIMSGGGFFSGSGGILQVAQMIPTPVPAPPLFIPPVTMIGKAQAFAFNMLSNVTLGITGVVNVTTYTPPTAVGNDENFIEPIQFSFRSHEQYGMEDDFFLFEPRWQRMYRIHGGGGIPFVEPAVRCDGAPEVTTYPSPGFINWTTAEVMKKHDTRLWDEAGRHNVDREVPGGGPYEDPKSNEAEDVILEAEWKISRQLS